MMASAKQMTRSRKPTRYVAAAALPQAEIRRQYFRKEQNQKLVLSV